MPVFYFPRRGLFLSCDVSEAPRPDDGGILNDHPLVELLPVVEEINFFVPLSMVLDMIINVGI